MNHTGPTVSSSSSGSKSITIEVSVIIDSRVFARTVKKVAWEDYGLQI